MEKRCREVEAKILEFRHLPDSILKANPVLTQSVVIHINIQFEKSVHCLISIKPERYST